TYVPGLMSASESFLATATCASGVRVSFRSLPSRDFTVRTSPSSDEIVPRTRMLLCASTVALESARARNSSFFMGTPPCVARLTPLSFAAFHVQSLPGDPERGSSDLQFASRQVPQEEPHGLVGPQPGRRAGRQLPRGPFVRPGRKP